MQSTVFAIVDKLEPLTVTPCEISRVIDYHATIFILFVSQPLTRL